MMRTKTLMGLIAVAGLSLVACGRKDTAARFAEMAAKQNKLYPQRLNEMVVVDSTSYDKAGNTVSYFYTVSGRLDDSIYMDKNYASHKQLLWEAVDNSVEMEPYRAYGTTVRYVYHSASTGRELAVFTFALTPAR